MKVVFLCLFFFLRKEVSHYKGKVIMGHQAIKIFLFFAGVEQAVHNTQMAGQRQQEIDQCTGLMSALAT